MAPHLFINLPVSDLDRSVSFYTSIGFTCHPFYTSPTTRAVFYTLNPSIVIMLLTVSHLKLFLPESHAPVSQFPSESKRHQLLNSIGASTREEVDEIFAKAVVNGGEGFPISTHVGEVCGGMVYGRCFADPDGHLWDMTWVAPEMVKMSDDALEKQTKEQGEKKE